MKKKFLDEPKPEDVARSIANFGRSLLYRDKPVSSMTPENRNELWEVEKLLTFDKFARDPEHMNFPPLSEKQKNVADFMIGDDPRYAFDNENATAVLCFGKGSGKDTMAFLITDYIVYLLLNLRNPQLFFGMPDIEAIDIVNVAASGNQARDVYFNKFSNSVKRWKWLSNRYKIVESGIPLTKDVRASSDTVNILSNAIIFPKQIRAISGHSDSETMEGKNILCFILDEYSSFRSKTKKRNADKIYRMLNTSAESRFGTQFKSFILSYPRYENDPILKMYEWSKDKLHVYGDKAATWEVKPRTAFHSKEDFDFEWYDEENKKTLKYKIPMDLKASFDNDPVDAVGKYICHPPLTDSPFIPSRIKIKTCVDSTIVPIVTFKDIIDKNRKRVQKKITGWNYAGRYQSDFIVVIDLGARNCAASLAVMRFNENQLPEVNAITRWLPDKETGFEVDIENVENVALEIVKKLRAMGVYLDQWNGIALQQWFVNKGVNCEIVSLYDQDYRNFRGAIFSHSINLINDEQLIREIFKLETGERGKVRTQEFKDMADSVITGYKVLMKLKEARRGKKHIPQGEGYIVGDNIGSQDSEDFIRPSSSGGSGSQDITESLKQRFK